MDDLIAFLRLRTDEDEQAAQNAGESHAWRPGVADEHWKVSGPEDVVLQRADGVAVRIEATAHGSGSFGHDVAAHIARHDPARVLAEVQAKRRLMVGHDPERRLDWRALGPGRPPRDDSPHVDACVACSDGDRAYVEPWPCQHLRLLAWPYQAHPDYKPEWAPEKE